MSYTITHGSDKDLPQFILIPTRQIFSQLEGLLDLDFFKHNLDTICPTTGKILTYTVFDDFIEALSNMHEAPEEMSLLACEIASYYKDKLDEKMLNEKVFHFGMMLYHYFQTMGLYNKQGKLQYVLKDWLYDDMLLVKNI